MFLTQMMHFLQGVFQMTAIVLVSVINYYHINGLHLFCDTLNIYIKSRRKNKWKGNLREKKIFTKR